MSLIWWTCGLLLADPSESSFARAEADRIELIQRVIPAVVLIFPPGSQAGGAGVLISADGFAITNQHVVGTSPYTHCGLADGTIQDAVIVGIDPIGDIALIKLLGSRSYPFLPWADSTKAEIGQPVLALGNPFLAATNLVPSVSAGIISGVRRYQPPSATGSEYTDALQTDAAINPGNSGGPLIDQTGQILGINGRISLEKRGRVNVGVAYAISAHQIQNFLPHLHGGLIARHASLGATVRTDDDGRVVVDTIDETSDAYRQGLRRGDELVLFADRTMRTSNQFLNVLGTLPAEWEVPITIRRAGDAQSIRVRLQELKRPTGPVIPKASPTLPESIRPHYRFDPRFANGFFQDQWREKLIHLLTQTAWPTSKLNFRFETSSGERVELALDAHLVTWRSNEKEASWPRGTRPTDDVGDFAPIAWSLDLRLLTSQETPAEFVGGFLTPTGQLAHVLETRFDEASVRWMFDAEQELLQGAEILTKTGGERWHIRWRDSLPFLGQNLPRTWSMESPGAANATWELTSATEAP